ncbi:hypothetical protein D3C85_1075720 [compost metagenome]
MREHEAAPDGQAKTIPSGCKPPVKGQALLSAQHPAAEQRHPNEHESQRLKEPKEPLRAQIDLRPLDRAPGHHLRIARSLSTLQSQLLGRGTGSLGELRLQFERSLLLFRQGRARRLRCCSGRRFQKNPASHSVRQIKAHVQDQKTRRRGNQQQTHIGPSEQQKHDPHHTVVEQDFSRPKEDREIGGAQQNQGETARQIGLDGALAADLICTSEHDQHARPEQEGEKTTHSPAEEGAYAQIGDPVGVKHRRQRGSGHVPQHAHHRDVHQQDAAYRDPAQDI